LGEGSWRICTNSGHTSKAEKKTVGASEGTAGRKSQKSTSRQSCQGKSSSGKENGHGKKEIAKEGAYEDGS